MTRLVDRPVEVFGARGPFSAPAGFRWKGRLYSVQAVLDVWPESGAWWDGETEVICFRLAATGGTVFELTRDKSGNWRLYRIYD